MKYPYRHMPAIHLKDVILRTIKRRDAKDMYDYGSNREVVRYLSWGPFASLSEAKMSIRNIFMKRLKTGLPTGYAIVDVKTSKMIGTIDFHSKIKDENGAEIGFVLHQDYWNKGIMSDALRAMVKIGFEHLKYDYIRIRHLKKNIASQKVILKCPFRLVSVEPFTFEKSTAVIMDDMLTYEITKEEYDDHQQSQGNL